MMNSSPQTLSSSPSRIQLLQVPTSVDTSPTASSYSDDGRNTTESEPTLMQLLGSLQRRFKKRVRQLVTPKRMLSFLMTQVNFFVAYGFFLRTDLYQTYVSKHENEDQRRSLMFFAAFCIHTMWLILLMFFNFCSIVFHNFRYYWLVKSLGENIVMLLEHLLIIGFGKENLGAALAMGAVLTIDTLCITNLLQPGHRYGLLTITMALTAGFGLAGGVLFGISAAVLIFLVLVIANFLEGCTRSQSR